MQVIPLHILCTEAITLLLLPQRQLTIGRFDIHFPVDAVKNLFIDIAMNHQSNIIINTTIFSFYIVKAMVIVNRTIITASWQTFIAVKVHHYYIKIVFIFNNTILFLKATLIFLPPFYFTFTGHW